MLKKNPKNIYTDLALEVAETLQQAQQAAEIDGVRMTVTTAREGAITTTWVEIESETGVRQMERPVGNYVTIESHLMKENDLDAQEETVGLLADCLVRLAKPKHNDSVLVVGLGNRHVTPDALGPGVVEKTLVTRHILESLPKQLQGKIRPVAAVAPGVMGTTGIETLEIIRGLANHMKPDFVIAIDALAARHTRRINAAIQLADTGISPGAGMGNCRAMLSAETLGVPVIGIGVPTVVDAATLVNDTMDMMLQEMIEASAGDAAFYAMLQNLENEEKYACIQHALEPYAGNMFVTPKDVDAVVERLAGVIANAINIALQPGIHKDDFNRFMA